MDVSEKFRRKTLAQDVLDKSKDADQNNSARSLTLLCGGSNRN